MVFDGINMWIVLVSINQIAILSATTFTPTPFSPISSGGVLPESITFDGNNIWVSNFFSDNIVKFDHKTGNVLGTFTTGVRPIGVAFDGAFVWVANRISGNIQKL
jgi:DNA-binding beta-propeller fold protein YncE